MTDAVRHEDAVPSLTPYLFLGLVLLVLALVARAPATLLQKAVPGAGPVAVTAWGGTLWHGQAALRLGSEDGLLGWELQPAQLLRGRLGFALQARGALALDGSLLLSPRQWQLAARAGEVPVQLLQVLLPPGWSLPGSVEARQLRLARAGLRRGPWRAAAGQLRWDGGPLQYNLGSQPQSAVLPPLMLALRLEGDALALDLREEGSGQALGDVHVAADGTVRTRLRERLLRYSGRTSGTDPEAVVVTTEQRLR